MVKKTMLLSLLALSAMGMQAENGDVRTDSIVHKVSEEADLNLLMPLQPTYLRNAVTGLGWDSNWFVEVKGGGTAFIGTPLGCGDLSDRITPLLQVGVGKWFTPSIGGRIEFQGLNFKNAELQSMKYQFVHADFMYNITGTFAQNDQGVARWDVIPFVGIGMIHNSDWKPCCKCVSSMGSNHPFAFSYGLQVGYRLTNHLHLIAEISGMTTARNFDGIGNNARFGDSMLKLSAGFSVTLGKAGWKRVIDAKPYIAQNEWLMDYAQVMKLKERSAEEELMKNERLLAEYRKILEIEGLLDLYKTELSRNPYSSEENLKNNYWGLQSLMARLNAGKDSLMQRVSRRQLDNQVPDYTDNDYVSAMVNEGMVIGSPVYFFFRKGKVKFTESSQILNVDEIAKVANKYNLKVKVIGAADSATGTDTRNKDLSEKRAKYIKKLLTDRSVDTDRITTVFEGGIDDYSPVQANRNTQIILTF